MMNRKKIQLFNDGILSICTIDDEENLQIVCRNIRFENRTVGAERFFKAREFQHSISNVVRIPQIDDIEDNYIVVINDKQYNILQLQSINDTFPPCWQLSLEKRKTRLELSEDD